jgi:sRNA-binding carbon storage regulator CsrA
VTVHREEVFAEIQRENRSAAAVSGDVLGALPRPPR